MAIRDIRDALVIRDGDLFLLTDRTGRVPHRNRDGYGLYYSDTRYISEYALSFATARPIVLLSTAELGHTCEQVLTNPAMADATGRHLPQGTIHIRRVRTAGDVLEETVDVTNYGAEEAEIDLLYRFAADFADIFEVRGHRPRERGKVLPSMAIDSSVLLSYKGVDGRKRETRIFFEPTPAVIQTSEGAALVTLRVRISPHGSQRHRCIVTLDGRLEEPLHADRFRTAKEKYRRWHEHETNVETDNRFFNAVLRRSFGDVRMLWNETNGPGYVAAGTPWYDTLFGRDTCILALQMLAFRPSIVADCLLNLCRWQGARSDPWRDEEPGKILHEFRQGELTNSGELPFSPYYGSIDSTPLFLWLAAEYYHWTGDLALMREIEPNLRRALEWLERHGDSNDDGFIDYEKRSSKGLVNQGWKDSHDSIVHADGEILTPPISLVEVQGYTYAALDRLEPVFEALGDGEMARTMRERARVLKRRFNDAFWLPHEGFYALALDGQGRPSAAITSNPGHALWSGIVTQSRARQVAQRLMEDDIFSGWGVRTMSRRSPRYNPQGYHLGTVWPHDNSLIAMGLKRFGFRTELNRIGTVLFDAARSFPDYRLPELFGGEERSDTHTPVPYPVACRPQAWAAGTFPLITRAMLGLVADGPKSCLRIVNPALPQWMSVVNVSRLQVGKGEVDLRFERHGSRTRVHVLDARNGARVETARRWPSTAAGS